MLLYGYEMKAFRIYAPASARGGRNKALYLCPDMRPQGLWIRVGIPVTEGMDNIL